MKFTGNYFKIVVESAGAVPFDMLMARCERFAGRRIGLIFNGGILDLDKLPWQK